MNRSRSRRHASLYIAGLVALLVALSIPASADAYVFWTASPAGSGGEGRIQRVNPDGTGLQPDLVADTISQDIAANSKYLFFQSQVIEGPGPEELGPPVWVRTNLDGGERLELPGIPFNTEAIAVDENHVYWEELGGIDAAGIGRANLDGSDAEPDFLTDLSGLGQYFAVYNGFAYWTYRSGDSIGRADMATKEVREEFVPEFPGTNIPEEPVGIAVDSQGIFWTYHEGEGQIGYAGLGGGSADLSFIGPQAEARRGAIAIDGSDLYWLGDFGVAHAVLEGGGGSLLNLHFFDDPGETLRGGLAVNSASSPPIPAPPPPPTGSPPPPTPAPLKSLPKPKLRLNSKAGLATLTVAVPGPGVIFLSGGGIKHLRKSVKGAGAVSLVVRPAGKTAKKLKTDGKVKVTAKLTFTPPTGEARSRVVKLTLKLG